MKQLLLAATAMLLVLAACTGGKQAPAASPDHAKLLKMEQCQGYLKVEVANPWAEGRLLHTYLLVPRDSALPAHLPQGTVVRTPITNALVYSEVHTSLMRELASLDAVRGVCDAQYFADSTIVARLKSGAITNCGNSQAPTIERVMAMHPDAILLSPYQDVSYGQLEGLNIPIIECADYLEHTPLGRMEWVKFYGALLGKRQLADSLYHATVEQYTTLCQQVKAQVKSHPTVLTEMTINGTWYVPAGRSYAARVIADAGGTYIWNDDQGTGSLSLTPEQVLARAQQADVWLIKWDGLNTLANLQAQHHLHASFAAFKQKHVWVCPPNSTGFFTITPFHPQELLLDFITVLHPELPLARGHKLRFYHHLEQ